MSIDQISSNSLLPDLAIGESVYIEDFGAYTTAASSNFNGFQHTPSHYIIQYYVIKFYFIKININLFIYYNYYE